MGSIRRADRELRFDGASRYGTARDEYPGRAMHHRRAMRVIASGKQMPRNNALSRLGVPGRSSARNCLPTTCRTLPGKYLQSPNGGLRVVDEGHVHLQASRSDRMWTVSGILYVRLRDNKCTWRLPMRSHCDDVNRAGLDIRGRQNRSG